MRTCCEHAYQAGYGAALNLGDNSPTCHVRRLLNDLPEPWREIALGELSVIDRILRICGDDSTEWGHVGDEAA